MIKRKHVDGTDKGEILMYTLSTCVWCKRTKQLLKNLGVAYDYIDVDLLDEGEKEQVMGEVRKWNPNCSFPTMVIRNETAVLGFDERKIHEALHL